MEDVWTRVRRMSILDCEWHARYPSIVRTAKGDLVVVFTRISKEQGKGGAGELVAVRSSDDGMTWSEPSVIHPPGSGEPRAMGTLAALKSGKVLGILSGGEELHLLASEDDGGSWSASAVKVETPLAWATPCGRIMEIGGELVVPVYGPASSEGEAGKSLEAGLVRSGDGGRTWGDYGAIAGGGGDGGMVCKDPAVVRKDDGRLVALVAGKKPSSPLHRRWAIFRTVSDDGGRSWTEPIGIVPGEAPSLTALPNGELAAAEVIYAGEYAWLRFQTSDDDFRTWRNYQECWSIRWFRKQAFIGRPAMLALDEETILAAFSRTRWTAVSGPGQTLGMPLWTGSGEESDGTEIDQERIEGVFFKRTAGKTIAQPQSPESIPDWRWVEDRSVFPSEIKGKYRGMKRTARGEFFAMEEIGDGKGYQLRTSADEGKTWSAPGPVPGESLMEKWESGHSPRPGVGTITRSGRRLLVLPRTLVKREGYTLEYVRTDEKGYGVWKAYGEKWKTELYVFTSDDEGKTWGGLDKPIDASPLNHVAWPSGHMYEEEDGTLVMNVWGDKTAADVDAGIAGIVLLRSHDGGATWGDPTVVAYGTAENGLRFNENSFAVFPDGTWVMVARVAFRKRIHQWALAIVRMVSTDRGRTWSAPEQVFTGGAPSLAILPDGGLVCAGSGGVYFSYDRGKSWTQKATYPNSKPFPMSDGTLMLIGGHYHGDWVKARILKRVLPE